MAATPLPEFEPRRDWRLLGESGGQMLLWHDCRDAQHVEHDRVVSDEEDPGCQEDRLERGNGRVDRWASGVRGRATAVRYVVCCPPRIGRIRLVAGCRAKSLLPDDCRRAPEKCFPNVGVVALVLSEALANHLRD